MDESKKRKQFIALFFLIIMISVPLFAQEKTKAPVKTQDNQIQAEVDGLSCPFCAYGLEKKLKAIPAIDKLDIDINKGLIKIYLKDGQKVNKKDINTKVAEAGFTLRKLVIDGKEYKFDNSKVQ